MRCVAAVTRQADCREPPSRSRARRLTLPAAGDKDIFVYPSPDLRSLRPSYAIFFSEPANLFASLLLLFNDCLAYARISAVAASGARLANASARAISSSSSRTPRHSSCLTPSAYHQRLLTAPRAPSSQHDFSRDRCWTLCLRCRLSVAGTCLRCCCGYGVAHRAWRCVVTRRCHLTSPLCNTIPLLLYITVRLPHFAHTCSFLAYQRGWPLRSPLGAVHTPATLACHTHSSRIYLMTLRKRYWRLMPSCHSAS